eukprot:6629879-Prymnesium_polylepis.1
MPHHKLGLCQLRRGDEVAPHWANPAAVSAVVEHCLIARTLQIGDVNGRNFLALLDPWSMPVAIDAAEQEQDDFNFEATKVSEIIFTSNNNGLPTPQLAS